MTLIANHCIPSYNPCIPCVPPGSDALAARRGRRRPAALGWFAGARCGRWWRAAQGGGGGGFVAPRSAMMERQGALWAGQSALFTAVPHPPARAASQGPRLVALAPAARALEAAAGLQHGDHRPDRLGAAAPSKTARTARSWAGRRCEQRIRSLARLAFFHCARGITTPKRGVGDEQHGGGGVGRLHVAVVRCGPVD
jgi:hypothetical protein